MGVCRAAGRCEVRGLVSELEPKPQLKEPQPPVTQLSHQGVEKQMFCCEHPWSNGRASRSTSCMNCDGKMEKQRQWQIRLQQQMPPCCVMFQQLHVGCEKDLVSRGLLQTKYSWQMLAQQHVWRLNCHMRSDDEFDWRVPESVRTGALDGLFFEGIQQNESICT
eukprot:Skav210892  [mRNA]  locus=scaffold1060:47046:48311:- [translate_table: standard]